MDLNRNTISTFGAVLGALDIPREFLDGTLGQLYGV